VERIRTRACARQTVIELAEQINIDPEWIYRGIAKGRIDISKDSR
jgi:hypothetical protein